MKSLVLVKIGGSLITDKNKPFVLNRPALKKVALEVAKAFRNKQGRLILGHGSGSFAHVPAKKYQTMLGIIDKQSLEGVARVQAAAAKLNRIVVEELIEVGLPAVSVSPSSFMVTKSGAAEIVTAEVVEEMLKRGLLPVVYGDVVMDQNSGCTILSTEKVLGFLAEKLKSKGYKIEKIIHCGRTNGVYDAEGKTVEMINEKNFETVKKMLDGCQGIDVTGGMLHKVEESLALAEKGIAGLIIDGVENGSLSEALAGRQVLGTRIEA